MDNFGLLQTSGLSNSWAGQPTLGGVAEAGAGVQNTDTVAGVASVLGTVRADNAGVWRFQASNLTSGSHSITTVQTDLAGNRSAASAAYAFTINAAVMGLPTLATASDTGDLGDGITREASPTLTGVAVTKGGSVQVYDGTVLLGTATSNATTGVWSLASGYLDHGVHRITAKDVTANITSAVTYITVDISAAAPVVDTLASANVNAAPTLTGLAVALATVPVRRQATDGSSQTSTTPANARGAWRIYRGGSTNRTPG